jgi:hypothetical protein
VTLIWGKGCIFQQGIILLTQFCFNSDSRLLLWCSGVMSYTKKRLEQGFLEEKE